MAPGALRRIRMHSIRIRRCPVPGGHACRVHCVRNGAYESKTAVRLTLIVPARDQVENESCAECFKEIDAGGDVEAYVAALPARETSAGPA